MGVEASASRDRIEGGRVGNARDTLPAPRRPKTEKVRVLQLPPPGRQKETPPEQAPVVLDRQRPYLVPCAAALGDGPRKTRPTSFTTRHRHRLASPATEGERHTRVETSREKQRVIAISPSFLDGNS